MWKWAIKFTFSLRWTAGFRTWNISLCKLLMITVVLTCLHWQSLPYSITHLVNYLFPNMKMTLGSLNNFSRNIWSWKTLPSVFSEKCLHHFLNYENNWNLSAWSRAKIEPLNGSTMCPPGNVQRQSMLTQSFSGLEIDFRLKRKSSRIDLVWRDLWAKEKFANLCLLFQLKNFSLL